MQRKIILFCSGLVVAILGFLAYQYFTGGSLNLSSEPKAVAPLDTNMTPGASHLSFEKRDANDALEYVFTADRSISKGGGLYQLVKPKVTYYMGDDVLAVTSDDGTIEVDQTGDLKNPTFAPKSGVLRNHVIITVGPKNSFVANNTDLQHGQIQARFDDPVNFDYSEQLLTSAGGVHVRGDQIIFDGSDVKVLVNQDQRRVELVRIEHGRSMTLVGVGRQALGLPGETSDAGGTAHAAAASAPGRPVAPAPAAAGRTVAAATKPGHPAYKLTFESNVKASLGNDWMTTPYLKVILSTFGADTRKAAPAQTPGAAPVASAQLQPTVAPASAPAKADDLVVTWSGPIVITPAKAADGQLVNPQDKIIEAVGTTVEPVILGDAEGRGAKAYRLFCHTADKSLQLGPGPNQPVELADAGLGNATCQGMLWQQDAGTVQLQGPGRGLFSEPKRAAAAPQGAASNGPILAAWSKSLDVELQSVVDAKKPDKKTQAVRRAVLIGDADVKAPTWHIQSDSLDVLLSPAHDAKSSMAFEHAMATGHVRARFAKTPGVAANDDDPSADSVLCAQLEVKTSIPPGATVPEPSEALATGDAVGVLHQVDKNDPQKVVTTQIVAPRLVAMLEPKGTGQDTNGLGGFGFSKVQALDGVKLQIQGMTPQLVVATAQTLTADAKTGMARLDGGPTQGRSSWAVARMGEDSLTGQTILLWQKSQSAQIPGSGEFNFVQPANKTGENPVPVKVTWADSMDYDGKALVAKFAGSVEARAIGKPDQDSDLKSDNLEVKMAAADGAKAEPAPNGQNDAAAKMRLSQMTATGNVSVLGANLDPDGKILQRFYLRAPILVYEEAHQTLTVPAAGELLFEDNRPEAAKPPAQNPAGGTDEAGSMRGQTAFRWSSSLVYTGDTGLARMKKDVYMRHVPLKVVAAKPNAMPDPRTAESQLQCQDLQAQLIQPKGSHNNPLDVGMGGQTRVGKVTADTGAILTLDTTQLAADVLEYDAAGQKAIAYGRNGDFATVVRPAGTASADRIEWDLGKGAGGLTLIAPHGQLPQGP